MGEWDFRFCGFGYFSDRFFRALCQKTAVFRFCRVVTVVCGFSVLKHLVFGICKKKKKKKKPIYEFGVRFDFRFFLFGF